MTALLLGCQNGHHTCVSKLLSYGADVSICDKNRRYGLHYCCNYTAPTPSLLVPSPTSNDIKDGHIAIMQLLLEAKHAVNVTDIHGLVPLHQCVQMASLPAVELLIESRRSPIMSATTHGYT
jgi:ankyrin repeat protein